ncbi:7522_t:CDS:2 [Dentiscutata erythropus]|uniref:7522_t:CDS:1 n=1 Tax=Dentiscutata erythropus TaxID=1348616 RepID=A0A9N9H4S8_9GLOM|nr:7522_t:CDS:2 [Dentiscutata erythropus]
MQMPFSLAVANKQEGGKYRNSKAITYSGSIFIRAHNSKHDSSTVYLYGKDFDELIVKEKLYDYTKMDGQPKSVIVILSDSGSNENFLYRKTIQIMIEYFDKYDLDTIIVIYFTLYQSASNLLRTVDEKLENHNFKVAEDVLTSMWEDTIINDYLIFAKYVNSFEEPYYLREKSAI